MPNPSIPAFHAYNWFRSSGNGTADSATMRSRSQEASLLCPSAPPSLLLSHHFHFLSFALPCSVSPCWSTCDRGSTDRPAPCPPIPLNLGPSTMACHGKWRTLERYHGSNKFSERWPQTTNTGHARSLLFLQNSQHMLSGGPPRRCRSKGWFHTHPNQVFQEKENKLRNQEGQEVNRLPRASHLLPGNGGTAGMATLSGTQCPILASFMTDKEGQTQKEMSLLTSSFKSQMCPNLPELLTYCHST